MVHPANPCLSNLETIISCGGYCYIAEKHWRWKVLCSSTQQVAETTKGEGELSQFAEAVQKAIQLPLDVAEQEKCPMFCLCTNSWMVANGSRITSNGSRVTSHAVAEPIWAAVLWQDISAWVECNAVCQPCYSCYTPY